MKISSVGGWRAGLFLGLFLPALAQAALRLDLEANHLPQARDSALQPATSAALELELSPQAREGSWTYTLDLVGFARYAPDEGRRQHADLREFVFTGTGERLEWRLGVGRVFWGVTEGAHLVDVINQDDALENLDGEDKLGQGMAVLGWRDPAYGQFQAYLLPHFRERRLPDAAGLELPFPLADQQPRYESAAGPRHVDHALRWQHYAGSLDWAVSWFRGTAREPRFLPCAAQGSRRPGTENGPNCDLDQAFAFEEPGALELLLLELGSGLGLTPSREELEEEAIAAALADVVLVPAYDQIEQLGLEAQWVTGGWAFKFEGRRRLQRGRVDHAAVAGFEYTQGLAFNWPVDLGYIVEYLYDERSGGASLSLFNNDVLLGLRALFSDVAGTQLLAGVIQDLDDRGRLFGLEFSRRLGADFSLAAELRIVSDAAPDQALALLSRSDFARLTLSYYW